MADLDKFIAAVLTPVSDKCPRPDVSTRKGKQEAWRRAELNTGAYSALRDLAHYLNCPGAPEFVPVIIGPSYHECDKLHRQAVLRQLLTPAVQKVDLDWKRRRVRMFQGSPELPAIKLAPAEDEASLAAKARRRA